MNKPSPKINVAALSGQKPPKKEKKQRKKKEKIRNESVRKLKFNRRRVGNILTVFFFSLFIAMAAMLLVFNSQLESINKVAKMKTVDPETIFLQVQEKNSHVDSLKYDCQRFLQELFTNEPNEEAKKNRTAQLQTYLSSNVSAADLLISSVRVTEVQTIDFISLEAKGDDRYRLFYSVTFNEGKQVVNIGIKLDVSYIDEKLQLLNIPSLTKYQEKKASEATESVTKNSFYTKGNAVTEAEKQKINQFLGEFFDMYVSGNEKLQLISAVQGLTGGTYERQTTENVVELEDGVYAVQGSFSYFYEKETILTSFYDLKIKRNNESFYVEAFN